MLQQRTLTRGNLPRNLTNLENVSQKIRETVTAKAKLAYVPLCFDEKNLTLKMYPKKFVKL